MDWSKAKTILIIALAATNILIGSIYAGRVISDRSSEKATAGDAAVYLQQQGAQLQCEIPSQRPKLPVLFVQLSRKDSQAAASDAAPAKSYKSYPIYVLAEKVQLDSYTAGKVRGRVMSASSALMSLIKDKEDCRGLVINNIQLVYYIDRGASGQDAEDTALPAWRIESSDGTYYCEALH